MRLIIDEEQHVNPNFSNVQIADRNPEEIAHAGVRALCIWVGQHTTSKSSVLERPFHFDPEAHR
jgi:hypothetical protein